MEENKLRIFRNAWLTNDEFSMSVVLTQLSNSGYSYDNIIEEMKKRGWVVEDDS